MQDRSKAKRPSGLADLLGEINEEIESEAFSELSPQEQKIETIAREILKLERDMTTPGQPRSDSARVDELMKFIAERDF